MGELGRVANGLDSGSVGEGGRVVWEVLLAGRQDLRGRAAVDMIEEVERSSLGRARGVRGGRVA